MGTECPKWIKELIEKNEEHYGFILRLYEELEDLKVKIVDLAQFIANYIRIAEIKDKDYWQLMLEQYFAMREYQRILEKRLEFLEKKYTKGNR